MERTTILIPRTRKHPRKNRWLGKDTPFLPLTGTRLNAAHIKAVPMKIATQYLQYQGGTNIKPRQVEDERNGRK
jgi:hypothetical protein